MSTPSYCRKQAFEYFCEHISNVDSWDGLLRSATAIAMHALPDTNPDAVVFEITALAKRVRNRMRNVSPEASLAHLHAVLFEEEQFRGDVQDYYDPANSFVPEVLRTKKGLPITLSLIYKCIATQLDLQVEGINAPGHFLVSVRIGGSVSYIDPFYEGSLLTMEEVFERIEQATGKAVVPGNKLLGAASHTMWISRMLNNLQAIYAYRRCERDLAAMQELQAALM